MKTLGKGRKGASSLINYLQKYAACTAGKYWIFLPRMGHRDVHSVFLLLRIVLVVLARTAKFYTYGKKFCASDSLTGVGKSVGSHQIAHASS